jgi:hypothetical protein
MQAVLADGLAMGARDQAASLAEAARLAVMQDAEFRWPGSDPPVLVMAEESGTMAAWTTSPDARCGLRILKLIKLIK